MTTTGSLEPKSTKPLLAVLTLFVFVNYLDRYALSMLLEPIRRELQLSDTQIGLLTGIAFAILYSSLAIPVARIAEHRSRTHVLTAAILIWSAGTALCGLAGSFASLLIARMIVGAGESGAMAPAHSLIGDSFPLERRGTAMAILSSGGALGTALAPMIGGLLEQHFGWRGAFIVLAALGLPVALLLYRVLEDPPRGGFDRPNAVRDGAPPNFGVALRRLFARPTFAILVPGMIAMGLADYSLFLWLPSYFSRSFGDAPAEVGAQLTLFQGLPLLLATLLGGIVADRLVRRDERWLVWLPMVACLVAAPAILLLFMAQDRSVALAALIIPSLACGLYLAPTYALIQALADAKSRATATAVVTLAVNLIGLGLGPLLLGWLSDMLQAQYGDASLRFAFFIVPPLYLIAASFYLVASAYLRADIEDAQQEPPLPA